MRVVRGRQTNLSPAVRITSTPRGKKALFSAQSLGNMSGRPEGLITLTWRMPGPESCSSRPPSRSGNSMMSVVERSGYSWLPRAKRPKDEMALPASKTAKCAVPFLRRSCASVKTDPAGDSGFSQCAAQPDRSVMVTERQQNRSGRRGKRQRRKDCCFDRLWCPDGPCRPSVFENPLGIEDGVGETARQCFGLDTHQSSPRTMVKKSTRVAAVSFIVRSFSAVSLFREAREARSR